MTCIEEVGLVAVLLGLRNSAYWLEVERAARSAEATALTCRPARTPKESQGQP